MRRFAFSVAVALAVAGPCAAQPNTTGSATSEGVRGSSAKHPVKKAAAVANQARQTKQERTTRPETLRGSRYGGFAPAPSGPPPVLDTTSPRTLNLVNFNTEEVLTVTYWSNGTYHREALDRLNRFLRDTRDNVQTEMDPLVLDVLWHTAQVVGYGGSIEVLSAYRSPTTNAWLASVSRGVARDSEHMNGNAMDVRFPGVPVFQVRQAAYSLNMGGVGFYPRSGFVHLDTGPVRYW